MNQPHLPEERLQLLAAAGAAITAEERLHLAGCADCQLQADVYAQLFSEIAAVPHASFDFALEETVMASLPLARKTRRWHMLGWILVASITGAGLLWAAKKYLLALVTGLLPLTLYTSVCSALVIFIFLAIDMYRRYQQILKIVEQ